MDGNDHKQMAGAGADPEMVEILEAMLEADETITARAVARKHPKLNHASSITRSHDRLQTLKDYQEKQKTYREWRTRAPKRSRDQLAAQLAQKDSRIEELERQVEILQLSHLAMIQTVGEMGGISKLLSLYQGYREFRGELDRLGVLPHGEVKQFELPRRVDPAEQ